MELIETNQEGVLIVEPRGHIDSVASKSFGNRLVELIRSGSRRVLIDFRQTLYINSAGFHSLLIASKLVEESNGKLVLCGVSTELRRLFEIGDFTRLFTICESRDEGVSKLK
jgi:anti-sigma B factor antagonist